jgi:Family of unknown function (DUF5996)
MTAIARTAWPRLALAGWKDTYETLHLWTQMLGKTRLALSPSQNHWWHIALYVSSRGLRTGPIPYGALQFEVELDLLDHRLIARTCEGLTRSVPLEPRPVADFYRDYLALLRAVGVEVRMWPVPSEIADPIRFPDDRVHVAYDADAAERAWRVMLQVDRVLAAYRGRFLGKSSPVHFFWGAFDLACTRFSGRRAPIHPGGVPNLPDRVTREGYSHECMSVGWWPGGGLIEEPSFYAYAYPEPPGFAQATLRPAAAAYHPVMHEWFLPYDAVREADDPDATLTSFLDSAYAAAADLGGWDRAALER